MKRQTGPWVRKAKDDLQGARTLAAQSEPLRDLVCFHCQQSAEKYLKALLQELGIVIPRTHNLKTLLSLLTPHDPTLQRLELRLNSLTNYAVEYRYPTARTTARQMQAALRTAERVRAEIRRRLKLS